MKQTAEGMVPFLAYLSSDEAGDITGKLFHLSADGEIGVWSDSRITRRIRQAEGNWTVEELRNRIPKELVCQGLPLVSAYKK